MEPNRAEADRDKINNADGDREDLTIKADKLVKHAGLIEKRIPLLSYNASDEIDQLKNYIINYYKPVLSNKELLSLSSLNSLSVADNTCQTTDILQAANQEQENKNEDVKF